MTGYEFCRAVENSATLQVLRSTATHQPATVTVWEDSLRGPYDLQAQGKSSTLNHSWLPTPPPTFLCLQPCHKYISPTFPPKHSFLYGLSCISGNLTASSLKHDGKMMTTHHQFFYHSNWQSRSKVTQTNCSAAADESDFFGIFTYRHISRRRRCGWRRSLVITIYCLQWKIMGIKGHCISYCLP